MKTRILAHHQQIVRVDWESVEFLTLETNKRIFDQVKKNINKFDGVIIDDYGKGVINPSLVKEVIALCKLKKKIVTVDPKEENFDSYEDVTALTPNLKEAQVAAGIKIRNKNEIELLGDIIMEKLRPQALLVTLGEDGMMVIDNKGKHQIPTAAQEVFDVTGAGDTVIASFTLALVSGASFLEAAHIANLSAGIVVGKLGAATTNRKELLQKINESKL